MKICSIVVELKSSVVRIFWISVLENRYIEKKQENGHPSSALIFLGQLSNTLLKILQIWTFTHI
jgi:hypothetical protein